MADDATPYQDWLAGDVTTLAALRAVYDMLITDERQLHEAETLVVRLGSRRTRHLTEIRLMLGARPGQARAHEAQEAKDEDHP